MIDIEKLKQVSLAATQGEWAFGSFSELLVVPIKNGVPDKYDPIANLGETAIPWDQDSHSAERYRNAEHIATANPSTVLELITRLEAAESQLETIAQQAEAWYKSMVGDPVAWNYELTEEAFVRLSVAGINMDTQLHAIKPFPFKEK